MFLMSLLLVFKRRYVIFSIIYNLISICFFLATKTNIDTTSSQEIIKTHSIMESLTLTTETDLLVTTSVQLSTNTETPVESSTPSIRQSGIVDFKTRRKLQI